jgi:hypothetical protein
MRKAVAIGPVALRLIRELEAAAGIVGVNARPEDDAENGNGDPPGHLRSPRVALAELEEPFPGINRGRQNDDGEHNREAERPQNYEQPGVVVIGAAGDVGHEIGSEQVADADDCKRGHLRSPRMKQAMADGIEEGPDVIGRLRRIQKAERKEACHA